MPIAQFEGKALVFNNGVIDVLQGETSLVDENKVAHIPEGNVLIDNETIIKNANNQLEIPIDEDTIYIDEHGFMKAKSPESSEGEPIELSSEGGLYFKDGGLAIKTGDSLEIVDNKIEMKVPIPQLPQDSEGEYILSFKNGILSWIDPNDYFQYKLVDRTLYLYYGKTQSSYTKYEDGAFVGLAPNMIKFDPTSPKRQIPIDPTGIFRGLNSLSLTVDLDITNLTSLKQMFMNCSHLYQIDLTSFDTTNITNMDQMFYGCQLKRLVGTFNTDNLNSSANMFGNGTTISDAPFQDVMRQVITLSDNYSNESVLVDNFIEPRPRTGKTALTTNGSYPWHVYVHEYNNELVFDDGEAVYESDMLPNVIKIVPASEGYLVYKCTTDDDNYDFDSYYQGDEFLRVINGYEPGAGEYNLEWGTNEEIYDEETGESVIGYTKDEPRAHWNITQDSEGYYILENVAYPGQYLSYMAGNVAITSTQSKWSFYD